MSMPISPREIRSLVAGGRAAASLRRLTVGNERQLMIEAQLSETNDDAVGQAQEIDTLIAEIDDPGWVTIETRGSHNRDGRITWECWQRRGGV